MQNVVAVEVCDSAQHGTNPIPVTFGSRIGSERRYLPYVHYTTSLCTLRPDDNLLAETERIDRKNNSRMLKPTLVSTNMLIDLPASPEFDEKQTVELAFSTSSKQIF